MLRKKTFQGLTITMILLALTSLSCGVSNLPFLATETPTPTNTFTPTPTFTPSPTSTPTQTPSATPTPLPTGVKTEEQSDGSTLFIDYDNKYQLVLPADWAVIPVQKDDFSAALDQLAKDNPNLADLVQAFKDMDPTVFRMAALNKNPDYLVNGFAANMNITAVENKLLSAMPLAFVTGALEETFKQQGAKVVTEGVNTMENTHGVEIEFIDLEQSVNGVKIAQRVIVFQTNNKLILLTTTASKQSSQDIFPESDLIGASVQFTK